MAASQKQAAKALAEATAEVARKYGCSTDSTIQQALIWAMERRGFDDFQPDEELIRRVRSRSG